MFTLIPDTRAIASEVQNNKAVAVETVQEDTAKQAEKESDEADAKKAESDDEDKAAAAESEEPEASDDREGDDADSAAKDEVAQLEASVYADQDFKDELAADKYSGSVTLKGRFAKDVQARAWVEKEKEADAENSFISPNGDVLSQVAAYGIEFWAGENAWLPNEAFEVKLVDDDLKTALAMDCAKAACESIKGRNDIVWFIFNDEMFERISLTRYIAHTTTRAVREGWIKTFFQPVVDAKTGELCGYEALCRWQDPERGMLSPGTFIPMLEDAHLIHQVDLCMLERVCSWISSRLVAGEPVVPISINLSRLDFLACDIVKTVIDACDRWCISHELLAVEVTESALSGDDKSLRRDMERFREAGFEVWMDDFGSGYSSLNLLKDYEFDVLKIDMVFLRDMDTNTRARKIVRSVVDMAKNLGLKTLVEGVETTSQRDFMRDIGCNFMQGYLFGRPEAID
jgi:EAL domain-containing protein (putative c-di-GMP-specific phosphodiesterase class I)